MRTLLIALAVTIGWNLASRADEPTRTVAVWPELAPGETTAATGETLPRRENENPPATRIGGITKPLLEFYEPSSGNTTGAAVVILPGGGFNYVVHDKEGVEIARWLNTLGVTGIVLRYRTKDATAGPHWRRPLADTQRSLSMLRAKAKQWQLDPKKVGVAGLSAGGFVAAMAATRYDQREYKPLDMFDEQSCRPDFTLLAYPGGLYDAKNNKLSEDVVITPQTPPTFLLHTHDDGSTSLGSVLYYAALKQNKVPAELHVYQTGGHGYGLRPVAGTNIHTWPQPAGAWLLGVVK